MEITWPLGNTFGVGAGKHRCGGGFQGLWKAGMWEMSMRFAFKRRTDSVRRRRGRRGFGRAYHSEWLIARSSHPPAQPWAARYVGCQQGLQKPALTLLRPAPAHTLLSVLPQKIPKSAPGRFTIPGGDKGPDVATALCGCAPVRYTFPFSRRRRFLTLECSAAQPLRNGIWCTISGFGYDGWGSATVRLFIVRTTRRSLRSPLSVPFSPRSTATYPTTAP